MVKGLLRLPELVKANMGRQKKLNNILIINKEGKIVKTQFKLRRYYDKIISFYTLT